MVNKVILVGRITRNLEIRRAGVANTIVGTTSIAVNTTRYIPNSNEKREEVCFIDLTFFGGYAESAAQYTTKGRLVFVEGRLKFDQWTSQTGEKRSRHSIIVENHRVLDTPSDTTHNPYNNNSDMSYQTNNYQNSSLNPPKRQISQPTPKEKVKEIQINDDDGFSTDDLPF